MSERHYPARAEERKRTSSQSGFRNERYQSERYQSERYQSERHQSERHTYQRKNFNAGWRGSKRRSHGPSSEHSGTFHLRKHYEFESVPDDVLSLEKLRPVDSKWDVKAKGFEQYRACEAKDSGLFRGVGVSGPDIRDAEQVKRLVSENSRQFSKVDLSKSCLLPNNSKKARIVILSSVDLVEHPLRRIKEVLEEYLKSSMIAGVGPQDCELEMTILIERSEIVITTKTTTVSTVLIGLCGTEVPGLEAQVQVERPNEYISSDVGQLEETKSDAEDSKIQDRIIECSQLICLQGIPYGLDKDKIRDSLQKYGELRSFSSVLDRITLETKGMVFFTYRNLNIKTSELEQRLREDILGDGEREKETAKLKCVYPCINSKNKYSQTITLDADTMMNVSNYPSHEVTNHGESKVVRFVNCLTYEDVLKPEKVALVQRSFEQECAKYGKVRKVVISKPGKGFKNGLGETDPSFGFVFVQFAELSSSTQCLYSLAGRTFYGRLVIGGYFDEEDFERGIY